MTVGGAGASLYRDNYNGGMYSTVGRMFDQGGFASGIYAGVMGGIPKMGVDGMPHLFAEKHLGVDWELCLFLEASKERNAMLLMEGARRIGLPMVPISSLAGFRGFDQGGTASRYPSQDRPRAPATSTSINVYGHRGMNVDELANAVMEKLEEALNAGAVELPGLTLTNEPGQRDIRSSRTCGTGTTRPRRSGSRSSARRDSVDTSTMTPPRADDSRSCMADSCPSTQVTSGPRASRLWGSRTSTVSSCASQIRPGCGVPTSSSLGGSSSRSTTTAGVICRDPSRSS